MTTWLQSQCEGGLRVTVVEIGPTAILYLGGLFSKKSQYQPASSSYFHRSLEYIDTEGPQTMWGDPTIGGLVGRGSPSLNLMS